ncbi:unnamed protein product, partial [Strongylus vulgaris]
MFSSFFNQVAEGLATPDSKPAAATGQQSGGTDFLGGLINVAKEVGQVINEPNNPSNPPANKPQETSGFKAEDIALISKGIGALVNTVMANQASNAGGEQT